MPVEDPLVIDLLAREPDGRFLLVMVEPRPWDGSDARLAQLQDKVNAYLAYALDGQLAREYPDASLAGLTLLLRCIEPPDAMVRGLVPPLRDALRPLDVRFEVQVEGERERWRDPDEVAP